MDKKKCNHETGARKKNSPRLLGEILHNYLENSNEPLAVAYREHSTEAKGQVWNRNTELAVDLKTILRSDRSMKTGKEYQGVLRRDQDASIEDFRCRDAHFTFVETLPQSAGKRNPHVFNGQYITVTRRDDGSLRLNFKPMKVDKDFSVYRYALGVFNELMWALEDLVESE